MFHQAALGVLARFGNKLWEGLKSAGFCVFLAFTLVYAALSPGTVLGQGYMPEVVDSARDLAESLLSWITFSPSLHTIRAPRHGLLEPVIELPFTLLSRIFGNSLQWADRLISFEPLLATSLLCTLVFLWTRKITSSAAWALILALVAGFSTMLWPYAYIHIETTQSLFLLLSGYLALGSDKKRTWLRAAIFALSCAVAVSVKANGGFLAPAIGFLILTYFWSESPRDWFRSRSYWYKTAGIMIVVGVLFLLNASTRDVLLRPENSRWMLQFTVGPVRYLLNLLSLFTSMNKGLFVFCPVTLLCFFYLKKAWCEDRLIVTFALLAIGGMALALSLVWWWSDEVWGPRYLHCAVAPLIICLALAKKRLAFRLRREIALIGLACCGLLVSGLGALFWYAYLPDVQIHSGPHSMEQLQYDVNWNAIRFDLKLLSLWLRGPRQPPEPGDYWPPRSHAWPTSAEEQAKLDLPPVNLSAYAKPQAFLIRTWRRWNSPGETGLWCVYAASLLIGSTLLGYLGFKLILRPDPGVLLAESPTESP